MPLLATLMLVAFNTSLRAQVFDHSDTISQHRMRATFYHNRFEGRRTASGEIFHQNLFTAAHKTLKLGTFIMVRNDKTGDSIILKINDRCPKRGILDLTRRACDAIRIPGAGSIHVRILGDDYEDQWMAQESLFDSVYSPYAASGKLADDLRLAQQSKDTEESASPASSKKHRRPAYREPEERFDIFLGYTSTHGEAFGMIEQLPVHYREKARVIEANEELFCVVIEVNMTSEDAKELYAKLSNTFDNCRVVVAN